MVAEQREGGNHKDKEQLQIMLSLNVLHFSHYGIHQQENKKPTRTLKHSGTQKS